MNSSSCRIEKVDHLTGYIGATRVTLADFSHLPVHCRFLALIPQWDFLNFLAEHGKRYPHSICACAPKRPT